RPVPAGRCRSSTRQGALDVGVGDAVRPGALGADDAHEVEGGAVEVVVDDHVVELAHRPDLLAGAREALLDLLLGVRAPAPQAPLELAHRRRRDEHHHRLRHARLDLAGADELELEEHVAALRQRLLDGRLRGAVEVADVLRVLEQPVVLQELLEALAREEVVVLAVDLAGALRAGRRRDRVVDVVDLRQGDAPYRVLADAGGAGHHEQDAAPAPAGRGHRPTVRAAAALDALRGGGLVPFGVLWCHFAVGDPPMSAAPSARPAARRPAGSLTVPRCAIGPGADPASRSRPGTGPPRPGATMQSREGGLAMDRKYIFITGGVVSSLGKGISTSSIGALLRARGYSVTAVKIDPYINVDAGTMRPYEHGEVFVTDDGAETDLDVGTYERFLDVDLARGNNVTTGQVYLSVIEKERRGAYLSQTVQVIPHVTDEIKQRIAAAGEAANAEIVLVEVGGTVGDIESLPFLEAIRQVRFEAGRENTLYLHVTLVPYLGASEEYKTKPTQHSVATLRGVGIQPDALILRSKTEIASEARQTIAPFTNAETDAVLNAYDAAVVYAAPAMLEQLGIGRYIDRMLGLEH